MKRYTFAFAMLAASTTVAAPPVFAQERGDPQGYIAVGVATLPEYEGADAQQAIPFVAGRAQWGHRYVAVEGVSARANLLTSPSWEFGPLASITFGRDKDAESKAVAAMAQIDDAVELGGFVSKSWKDVGLPGGEARLELRATTDVSDVHGAWQSSVAAGYAAPLGDRWRVGADLSATLVSDDYAETYFSITPANAVASGLEAFDAKGGLKDFGINVNATYALTERWSFTGFAQYRRLLGDAADSPIVDREGMPDQLSAGLGIGYSF